MSSMRTGIEMILGTLGFDKEKGQYSSTKKIY